MVYCLIHRLIDSKSGSKHADVNAPTDTSISLYKLFAMFVSELFDVSMIELKPYFEFISPATCLKIVCTVGEGATYDELQSKHIYNPDVQTVGLSLT